MKIERKYAPPLALLLVSVIGTAYALTTLFTQTFPAIPPLIATANCTNLKPFVATVGPGSSGTVQFDCSGTAPTGTTPAFHVLANGVMTPTFTLPPGYTGLSITSVPNTGIGGACGSFNRFAGLTSGVPITVGPGDFDYCGDFSSAPSTGLATFDIMWSA